MGNPSWDEDGVGGGPSSMEVLIQWLGTSGNARRWLKSARKGDGSRLQMTSEIYDQLVLHGISIRTVSSINTTLWNLERQLQCAEYWLKSRGLHRYNVSKKTQQEVLRICPYYPVIKPLFRPKYSRTTNDKPVVTAPATYFHSYHDSNSESNTDVEYHSDGLSKVGLKRDGASIQVPRNEATKRPRVENNAQTMKLEVLLEAELDERHEFFELEIQVKRDEAILVGAKARKKLIDMGFPLADVNRLLPL